jgi:Matrixin
MLRALVAAAVLTAPSAGLAYGLKTASTGELLRWPGGEIPIEVALTDGPPEVTDAEAVGAIQNALASWQAVLDGSEVSVALSGNVSGAVATGDGINSVRWAMDEGDGGVDVGLLAKTHLSYRVDDGSILEADVVVNAVEFRWTLTRDGCVDQYDLEGSLSHEFGHVLGLAHSADEEATMFATGHECETIKRDLNEDDGAAIDYLYRELPPPGGVAPAPLTCAAAGGSSWYASLALLAAFPWLVRRRRAPVARLLTASLVAVGALAAPASAAQLREVELGELVARAELVVRGVVIAVEPARDGELATDSELAVTECLAGPTEHRPAQGAGDCPDTVRVRRRGGEQDGRGMWVDGEADLVLGQEVVLFLRARPGAGPSEGPKHVHAVVGGIQGALRVVNHGGGVYAARDLRGHQVLQRGSWRRGGVQLVDLAELRRSIER